MDAKAKVTKASSHKKYKKDPKKSKVPKAKINQNQEPNATIAKGLKFTINQKAITTISKPKASSLENESLLASTQIYAKKVKK